MRASSKKQFNSPVSTWVASLIVFHNFPLDRSDQFSNLTLTLNDTQSAIRMFVWIFRLVTWTAWCWMWSRPHAFCTLHDCQCLRGIQKEAFDIDYAASKTKLVRAFHQSHNLYQNLTENCNANLLKAFRAVAKALHQCCLHLPGPSCAFRGRACGPGELEGWDGLANCRDRNTDPQMFQHNLRCTRRLSSVIPVYQKRWPIFGVSTFVREGHTRSAIELFEELQVQCTLAALACASYIVMTSYDESDLVSAAFDML